MKKNLFLISLLLLSTLPLWSQIGEPRHAIAIGLNGGVTFNSVGFDPTVEQNQLIGPTFGATFRITSEKYFKSLCALQIELNYAQLGWKEDVLDKNSQPLPDTYQRTLNYIQLPFLARMGWGYEQKGAMFYVLAGPQLGFCFKESSKRGEHWTLDENGNPNRPNNMYEQYNMNIDRKFDYGITAGIGIELNTKIGHFLLDGRYYYGLSDIFNNGKKDVFARSNNGTIIAKFTYLIDIKK